MGESRRTYVLEEAKDQVLVRRRCTQKTKQHHTQPASVSSFFAQATLQRAAHVRWAGPSLFEAWSPSLRLLRTSCLCAAKGRTFASASIAQFTSGGQPFGARIFNGSQKESIFQRAHTRTRADSLHRVSQNHLPSEAFLPFARQGATPLEDARKKNSPLRAHRQAYTAASSLNSSPSFLGFSFLLCGAQCAATARIFGGCTEKESVHAHRHARAAEHRSSPIS